MRLGRIRARDHDRVKGHVFAAVQQHQVGQPRRDLLLGHARADIVQRFRERAFRDALGADDAFDLARLLDKAQPVHKARLGRRFGRQPLFPALVGRKGQRLVLKRNALRAVCRNAGVYRFTVAHAGADLAHLEALDLRARRFDIAEIREENGALRGNIARARRGVEPRGIAAVLLAGQQERVKTGVCQRLLDFCDHTIIAFTASTASR